jgi:hypothetical protein
MYMRAVTVRIVYVGIVSLGILLSAAFRDSSVQAAPVAAAKPQSSAAVAKTPRPVTTLPTVRVTASRATIANTSGTHLGPVAAQSGTDEASADVRAAAALPSLRLDMPYYSFGKLLPHVVGKE